MELISYGHQPSTSLVPPRDKVDFSDLSKWRLSQGEGALAGAREVLGRLPVRKSTRQEFIRTRISDEMSLVTNAYEDKDSREFYLISPPMVPVMLGLGEVIAVKLVPAITRQGVLILVPAKLPNEASSVSGWQDTMLLAMERAKTKWVRVSADMSLGGYRIYEAEGDLSEPEWPDMSLSEMLEVAFKDRVIDSEDHPIFNKLLGRV